MNNISHTSVTVFRTSYLEMSMIQVWLSCPRSLSDWLVTYLYWTLAVSGTFASYRVSKNWGSRWPTKIFRECMADFCWVSALVSTADTPISYSLPNRNGWFPIVRTTPLSASTWNRFSPPKTRNILINRRSRNGSKLITWFNINLGQLTAGLLENEGEI